MNFFNRLFNRNRLTDEKMWNSALWNLSGPNESGETVNEYTALTYSAVWNAVNLISGTIGALPLHLMRESKGKKNPETKHGLYKLLHSSPNPHMTAKAFRETMLAHILTWGNGYAEKVISGQGDIIELWPIPPNRVTPEMENGKMVYRIQVDGKIITLGRDRIMHIAGLGFDGFIGYSVISMAAQSIGLSKALETFGATYFGKGTHPGVIVSHPGKLSDTANKNLKSSLTATYSGLGKSHRLMLLEEGMKLEKLGVPPNDSQFLETRGFQISDVARWFNLPPHKLKDLSKSSFNNIESEQISFVTDSLLPWSVLLEQSYNMQLLSVSEFKRGYYFKHIFEGLLRGNSAERAAFYSTMFNIGAMSVNEIRAKEDLNPVEGGDIHLVPLNMTTLANAGKPIMKEGKNEDREQKPVPEKGGDELPDRE